MTNAEYMENIRAYQEAGYVHPLTCGNNSLHRNLEPKEVSGKVILFCPDCDYWQTEIPPLPTLAELTKMRPFWLK